MVPARRLAALVVCLAFSLPAIAQSGEDVHLTPAEKPAPAADGIQLHVRPFTATTDLVLVPVSVTDNYGHPVLGLHKEDFRLTEDEAAQEIRHFSADDAPISIGLILDLSASMQNKINDARLALGQFMEESNPGDDYFVITFADRPQILADTTTSIPDIRAKLASATPGGHTALLDAIYLGITRLRKAKYPRHALLIISDGGDNRSRFNSHELKQLVEESDTQIYAIGIYDSFFRTPEEWNGKRLLTEITESTGGHTVTLNNVSELPAIASALSTEMRNQYVLGYRPPAGPHDGKWRKIHVQLIPPPEISDAASQTGEALTAPKRRYYSVHWKRGYNAPQE